MASPRRTGIYRETLISCRTTFAQTRLTSPRRTGARVQESCTCRGGGPGATSTPTRPFGRWRGAPTAWTLQTAPTPRATRATTALWASAQTGGTARASSTVSPPTPIRLATASSGPAQPTARAPTGRAPRTRLRTGCPASARRPRLPTPRCPVSPKRACRAGARPAGSRSPARTFGSFACRARYRTVASTPSPARPSPTSASPRCSGRRFTRSTTWSGLPPSTARAPRATSASPPTWRRASRPTASTPTRRPSPARGRRQTTGTPRSRSGTSKHALATRRTGASAATPPAPSASRRRRASSAQGYHLGGARRGATGLTLGGEALPSFTATASAATRPCTSGRTFGGRRQIMRTRRGRTGPSWGCRSTS
mmetsp:Transcript_26613/g.67603  ORF Transcript_26613/g.67603 Transcript_26613/m.67603 type:complete len:368 (-) Transcript_26613:1285-2388(-)